MLNNCSCALHHCFFERVEQVQRRFTKARLKNYSYADRLKLLNLSSLELRRIHNDLAWCYKIVFGLTILKFDDFFQWNTAPQTRGYPYRLYKTNSTRRARTVFFSEPVINVWNHLPVSTNFGSMPLFMRSIRSTDLSGHRYL